MTAVSKNVYIDKLDDIVNKYNNACHRTIKMKPIDVKDNTYIDSIKEVKKILHFKLLIMLEYQNTKTFLLMNMLQICQKKFLWLKKLKIQFHGHMLLMISMVKKLSEHFMKKNNKKSNQQEFRIEKVIKRKGNKLYIKWKGYDNSFNSSIDKKDLIEWNSL